MKINPYVQCPTYETEAFLLRIVKPEDASDLLCCYSDKEAVARMNADNCTSDFYYTTLEQMQDCIAFWLDEYVRGAFIRFTILDKKSDRAVGTIEIFGGEFGVLRIDIASSYEKASCLDELVELVIRNFISDFDIQTLVIKVTDSIERMGVIKKHGFIPSNKFRPGMGYFEYKKNNIAYCGLGCCVCSENENCPGCQAGGCDIHGWCKNYNCCREKGLNGCWECSEFPCSGGMLDKSRIRAFSRFAKEYGTDELVRCLMNNKDNGIVYHYDGQLIGDYDKCERENEIIEMIRKGVKSAKQI